MRGEEDDPGLGFRDAQLEPALFLVERLIGDDGEPELVRIEIERAVLIGHRDADELDLFNHDAASVGAQCALRPETTARWRAKLLSV